jgi:hypothetical protein
MGIRPGENPYDRDAAEANVKKLTADFVEVKTAPPHPYLSETARNLLRVAGGKDNDPKIIERAVRELQRFREEPAVAAFFAELERVEAEKVFRARILALKRGGFLKKIGGDSGK